MSELLSTGQMIDALKVGEVAETEEGYRVTRNENMSITYINKEPKHGQFLTMNLVAHRLKWRIQPNYVSFEEAMKAHKEDKETITYHHDSELSYTFAHEIEPNQFQQIYYDSINLHEMLEGKWTIK